ncbi:hypothetical protein D3C85_720870 [compost metagenome]
MAVAGQGQLRFQARFVELFALLEEEGVGGQERWRRQAHERRGGRHDQHVALTRLDFVQGGQALGDQVLVRRERVVGQGFPVRQQMAAQFLAAKPRDFIEQALAVAGLRHHHGQHLAPRFQGRSGQRQGIGVG